MDYFNRRPPGWKDDLRTFYIMQSGMGKMKKKPEDIFPAIKQVKMDGATEDDLKTEGAVTAASVKQSPFGALLASAGIK